MDKPQNHYLDGKKSNTHTKKAILYDSIYIKMKNRQNQSIKGEKRTVASRTGKGHKRTFRSDDSNLSRYRGLYKQPNEF